MTKYYVHWCVRAAPRYGILIMNLRNRSLLALGLTFFVFFLVIAVVSLSVTMQGLDRLEYQNIGASLNQSRSAIDAEASSLLLTTHDWAWWDDMAGFAINRNPGFLEANANPDAMRTLNVHLFVILDTQGTVLYSNFFTPDFAVNSPVPDTYLSLVRTPRLTSPAPDDAGISGLLMTPDGPMILAAAPILNSDMSGPARGTVIMGRYLDYGPLQRIDEITGFSVSVTPPDASAAQPAPGFGSGKEYVVSAENETSISGYGTVSDLAGRNLLLRVTTDRGLYRTGLANITTYIALLGLWAVMLGIIVLVVIDRTVLGRLALLTSRVRGFDGKGNDVPVLSGGDELAALERTIIESRRDLLLSEQQLRIFINAMPGPAALFSRDGTILLANPAFAENLGRTPEEITGSPADRFIPPEELQKYNRFAGEAIRKKEAVHFEQDAGGKTLFMSYYPVLGNDGEVIQLGLMAFDISERKRLENALQKVTKKMALLNTVIFSDIQNKVFVQMGYLELARQVPADPALKRYLEKEDEVVREIQSALRFAKQYNDMGINPPRWQMVQDVMLFAVSHLDLGSITRDFSLGGLEIYTDSLLERVFVTLVENTILHAHGATAIRAGYTIEGEEAVIWVEDNGPGVEDSRKEQIFRKGTGAGGSASLFLSREILSITGISIRENGVFGKGARFELRVPKGSYRFSG